MRRLSVDLAQDKGCDEGGTLEHVTDVDAPFVVLNVGQDVHIALFVRAYLYMAASPTSSDKWRYTLYTTLVLLLLFNPWTFQLTSSVVPNLSNKNGCPTVAGLAVHAAVFALIVRYMMDMHI
jgi:hypothetical protein